MTADELVPQTVFWLLVLTVSLAAQNVWLRKRLQRRLHARLVAPFGRWVWDTRRALAALDRAAHLRPYRPTHHTPRHIHEARHDH